MHGAGFYKEKSMLGDDVITWFIVMDEMKSSLHDWIYKEPAVLTPANVLRVALEISSGLEFLHSLQIIHRDIKPENILVS